MTFGIPRETLPVDESGNAILDNHRKWLQRRMQIDNVSCIPIANTPFEDKMEMDDGGNRKTTANANDVLFGRGLGVQCSPGNARFRQIIDLYADEYEQAGKAGKTAIAENIIRLIQQSGARFLKTDGDGFWEEADDKLARAKVSHTFRTRRKSRRERDLSFE